jgi:hypothetical protein
MSERAIFNCGTVDCWRRVRKQSKIFFAILYMLSMASWLAVIFDKVAAATIFALCIVGIVIFIVALCCRGLYSTAKLRSAIDNDQLTTVRWMLRKGELARPQNALVSLNDTKDLDMMRLLIDGGVDVNEPGSSIYTPLHSVASRDNLPMARLLLERGANVNDTFHQRPSIFYAVSVPMAQLLIEAGADITDEGPIADRTRRLVTGCHICRIFDTSCQRQRHAVHARVSSLRQKSGDRAGLDHAA